ncbi:hypothetical protein LZ32DRAFT_418692 [Colletotrichum eremochloae]|nr:hypothetical protein LZ32DRAFT_418692 [Colletotrichum eremochloae]
MTKTRPARTAVRSAIASTTVLSDKTTLPASSAVSVATLDTWPEIAPTDRRVLAGATTVPAAVEVLPAALEAETPSTASTSNLCKNSAVVPPAVLPPHVSKPALVPTTTALVPVVAAAAVAVKRGPGSAALPAVRLPGVVVTTTRAMIATVTVAAAAAAAAAVDPLRGLATATAAMTRLVVIATMVAVVLAKAMAARQLRPQLLVLPLGINPPEPRTATRPMVATPGTVPRPAWPHLRAFPLLLRQVRLVSELLRAWLVVSTHLSSNTPAVRRRRLPQTMRLPLLLATSLLHLLPLAPDLDSRT